MLLLDLLCNIIILKQMVQTLASQQDKIKVTIKMNSGKKNSSVLRNLLCKVCFIKSKQDNIKSLVTVLLQHKLSDIAKQFTFYLCCNEMSWMLIDLITL